MRPLDRRVDRVREPEVVAGYDDPFHGFGRSPLARRKWMNSTPSRSRRFVISQLLAISKVISAIFRGLK
jgi:hypothetical protein